MDLPLNFSSSLPLGGFPPARRASSLMNPAFAVYLDGLRPTPRNAHLAPAERGA